MSPKFTTDLENFIRRNEEERTELLRQNQVMLLSFVASFEERFPKEPDPEALARDKRDWLAGQALAGLCANSGGPFQANEMSGWGIVNCDEATVAGQAYRLADAMLAERSKP